MKSIKHIALGIFVTLSVFCAVLYTSCSKDGCKGVTCLNGGVCSSGICTSCPSGTGGSNCQTIYRTQYLHTYIGNAIYNYIDSNSQTNTANDSLTFTTGSDSMYAQMKVSWTRHGRNPGTAQFVLDSTNSSANGSTFQVSFKIDTFTYVGTGSINATTASMNLTEMHDSIVSGTVTLSNFTRQ